MRKDVGFTLAEILITLGVIGVIAALTIPILMANIQDMQYKIAYKKAYSMASQVLNKLASDNKLELLCRSAAGGCDGSTNVTNFNSFRDEFRIVKDCSSNNNSQCWLSSGELYQGFWPSNSQNAFIDNSGMAWTMVSGWNFIAVDTNGFKPPNLWGKDRFPFAWAGSPTQYTTAPNPSIPTAFAVPDDSPGGDTYCPTGPCHNKTWLYN